MSEAQGREPDAFYWVRWGHGTWEPMRWVVWDDGSGGYWERCGDEEPIPEAAVRVVGPTLVPPIWDDGP